MASSSKSLDLSLVLLAVCLFGLPGESTASPHTSTYVFVPEQSKVVQTGGIAYVHWTYTIKGHFRLTVDPNAGTASFTHVDANATDDSPFKRTLDPNRVFNMTSLVGTVEPNGSIKFTGKAPDDSDVCITIILQNGLAHLIGQTTPPPNSADFFIFSLDAVAQLRKYSGGSGTAEDPYQIATAEDLIALGETPEDYDKHFILTENIDLDPNIPGGKVFDKAVIAPDTDEWTDWFQGTAFTGVFDGKDHIVRNLNIDARGTDSGYLGLFGMIGESSKVKNLGVEHANIAGGKDCLWLGVLVGDNLRGTIFRCHTSGSISVTLRGYGIGGLVGYNREGTIINCHADTKIRGADTTLSIGGLVGDNASTGDIYITLGTSGGWIANCYATGSISGGDTNICLGGLVGYFGDGSITNSYSTANVTAGKESAQLGGLVGGMGTFLGDYGGLVTNCYAAGSVRAGKDSSRLGGLVGDIWLSRVSNCFWDVQTSGQFTSAGGTGKTTAEMQMASTFLDAGWDFVSIWGIGENQTYPYLRKYSAADINQDGSVNLLDLSVLAENWLATKSEGPGNY